METDKLAWPSDLRLGFIGAGNMAEAIVHGALAKHLLTPPNIIVSDIKPERLAYFNEKYRVGTSPDALGVIERAEIVVLATKPQDISAVAASLSAHAHTCKLRLLISICAGVSTQRLEREFAALIPAGLPIVRVMPNLPAIVGNAASGVAAGNFATTEHVAWTLALFRAVGVAHQLPEELLDAVTGVSGSGPAYVFLLMEAMIDGAIALGIPADVARDLVLTTVLGAARLAISTADSPAEWRQRVTSPGGTTAAGLAVLESAHFRDAVINCIAAATNRGKELGRG